MNVGRTTLAALLLLTACDAAEAPQASAPASMAAETVAVDAAVSGEEYRSDGVSDDEAAPAARMVIRNAQLHLRADTPDAVVAAAAQLVESAGGFVASSDTQGVGLDVQRVDASLRVPAQRFASMLEQLRSQGELLQETVTGEDVTEQHADLDARLRSQRVLEERLLAILGGVESVEDALAVETQLVGVRTEIERLEGRLRTMEDRVTMATITLTVEAPHRASMVPAETVGSRLQRAWDDAGGLFVSGLAGLIRIMGALLPLMLVFGPLGLLGRHLWRRRRRQQALITAATGRPPVSGEFIRR